MIKKRKRISDKRKIDYIVLGTCIYIILFVIISFVTYWIKDGIPDTLVQYGLGGGVFELILSAMVEIFSNKRRRNIDEEQTYE